ncbi:CzcC cation outer membrane efflux system protein [Cellvibrio sp. BR]|uniref:TolC family protein n=1 Tax=Cellvibrio sp. BR TaxID=1134474 RepID=UPI00026009E7|nr:TolC family protein [Cellvibrio sp. BR]EIK46415.1 CzcC cation outer membrane efflux system protein [Cellvibrio sp. BR]
MNKFSFALPLLVSALACPALADGISLQDALSASLQHNPQLAGYQFRRAALAGEQTTAALRPEMRLHSELENVAGSGDFSGADGAELTLSFASIIELGDQRDARLGVVTARQQQLATEQRVAVLDLVAAVNYRFIALIAAQEQEQVQKQAQQLAQSLVTSLSKRVQAGRAPQEELLRARAAQAKAALDVDRARQKIQLEALKLSAYWADSTPDFTRAQGDLFALTNAVPLADWQTRLAQNPDLLLLAEETRLRAAELRKAEAEGQMTLGWSAGVRQLQATDDTALVAGINIPLASGKRASGAISKARAEQDAATFAADSAKVQLEARLNQTYSAHTQALAELHSLRDQILPLLQDANRATAAAFDQGRYSSLELALAQRELLEARAALIDAALRAHETRIELERLTASAPVQSTQSGETTQ